MESVSDERRRQILAMRPEDRAMLADLIRRERDKIPAEIARLQDEQQRLGPVARGVRPGPCRRTRPPCQPS